jgi:hypothetical protein
MSYLPFKGTGVVIWHGLDPTCYRVLLGQETLWLNEHITRFTNKYTPANVVTLETYPKNSKISMEQFFYNNAKKLSQETKIDVYYNKPVQNKNGMYQTHYRFLNDPNKYGTIKGGTNKTNYEIPIDVIVREFTEEIGPYNFDFNNFVMISSGSKNSYASYSYEIKSQEQLDIINNLIKKQKETLQGELINLDWHCLHDVENMLYNTYNKSSDGYILNMQSYNIISEWFTVYNLYSNYQDEGEYYQQDYNHNQNAGRKKSKKNKKRIKNKLKSRKGYSKTKRQTKK